MNNALEKVKDASIELAMVGAVSYAVYRYGMGIDSDVIYMGIQAPTSAVLAVLTVAADATAIVLHDTVQERLPAEMSNSITGVLRPALAASAACVFIGMQISNPNYLYIGGAAAVASVGGVYAANIVTGKN